MQKPLVKDKYVLKKLVANKLKIKSNQFCIIKAIKSDNENKITAILRIFISFSSRPHTKFQVDHYNELIKVYIANNRTLTARTFINEMNPVKPNITTYELILQALGEVIQLASNIVMLYLASTASKTCLQPFNMITSVTITHLHG